MLQVNFNKNQEDGTMLPVITRLFPEANDITTREANLDNTNKKIAKNQQWHTLESIH